MTDTLRKILIVFMIIYFMVVFRLLKKKHLMLKYALLWLFIGVAMSLLVLFPQLLYVLSHIFGIVDMMNCLFTFAIGFVIVLLMAQTAIVSKQSEKIKNLVQDNALLEKRIRSLEKEQKKEG